MRAASQTGEKDKDSSRKSEHGVQGNHVSLEAPSEQQDEGNTQHLRQDWVCGQGISAVCPHRAEKNGFCASCFETLLSTVRRRL